MFDYTQIKDVLDKKQKVILKKKGIVATGIGYKIVDGKQTKELSIICSVDKKLPLAEIQKKDLIPSKVKGVITDVVEIGIIKALHKERHRPAQGGISIGHKRISAGTLGCVVTRNGKRYILSNNHVLSCSNDANLSDPIIQPGNHDLGKYPEDIIAYLSDFIPINFVGGPSKPDEESTCSISNQFTRAINGVLQTLGRETRVQAIKQTKFNLVDAAIAIPSKEDNVSNEIMGFGKILGVKQAKLGMIVKKSGRTTGLTTGKIIQVNVTTTVQYGDKNATFTDQFMTTSMSESGDSGSACLTEDNYLTGLLYAGSEYVTLYNRIENVFKALNVQI